MARNSLSEEDALKRIRAQMSNTDRIARAHVVLSNGKDLDATKAQASRAWEGVCVCLSVCVLGWLADWLDGWMAVCMHAVLPAGLHVVSVCEDG